MVKHSKIFLLCWLTFLGLILWGSVFAQDDSTIRVYATPAFDCPPGMIPGPGPNGCQLGNPISQYTVNLDNFPELFKRFLQILLYFTGSLAVLFLMIGGYRYIAARGNEEATEKAKSTIRAAVIALFIILLAYTLVVGVNALLQR